MWRGFDQRTALKSAVRKEWKYVVAMDTEKKNQSGGIYSLMDVGKCLETSGRGGIDKSLGCLNCPAEMLELGPQWISASGAHSGRRLNFSPTLR